MKFVYPFGATPIEGDEIEALLPEHITLQSELNEWEQPNILEAEKWGERSAPRFNGACGLSLYSANHYKQLCNKQQTRKIVDPHDPRLAYHR